MKLPLLNKLFGGRASMSVLRAGAAAPDFTLPTVDGHQLSLQEALGHGPVVLIFFKVGCPTCQYAFPFFERMYQASRGTGVSFIGVSQDDLKHTQTFLKQFGSSFPVALDDPANYTVSNAYGLTNVPTLFYIDPSGEIEISSVSWSKSDIEAISARIAESRHQAPPTLWHTGEEIRDFRAG